MSESSLPYPPPPPLVVLNDGVLGRKIPGVHKTLFWVSIAALLASIVILIAEINNYQFMSDLKNEEFASTGEMRIRADEVDSFIASAYGFGLLIYVVLSIVFLVWLNKMTKNLNDSGYKTKKGSRWVVGSFFIPVANYFLVFGSIKDLLFGLGKAFPALTNNHQKTVKTWWILFSISAVLMRASSTELSADADIDQYLNLAGFSVCAALLNVVALGFGVKAFKQLRDDTKTI
jgi:uncharacterized RDD family membrane protein YckC